MVLFLIVVLVALFWRCLVVVAFCRLVFHFYFTRNNDTCKTVSGQTHIYLLLTEFEGRTVSYGPSFFLLDLWPKRKARGP